MQVQTWSLITLQPIFGAEHRVLNHLLRLAVLSYRPIYRAARVVRGQLVDGAKALFPGYLFIADATAAVQEIDGVRGFVMDGERRWVDSHGVVAGLRAREDDTGYVQLPEPPPRFAPGDGVVVQRGLLQHRIGHVASLDKDVVSVVFNMLGTDVLQRLHVADVDEFVVSKGQNPARSVRRKKHHHRLAGRQHAA